MGGLFSVFAVRAAEGSTEMAVEETSLAAPAAAKDEPLTPIRQRFQEYSNYYEGKSPEMTIGRFRVTQVEATPF